MKLLFVTWDGPQVSYLEGLFLPIFARLHREGVSVHVLQFTWGDQALSSAASAACAAVDIPYRRMRVARWPRSVGALAAALAGARAIGQEVRRYGIDVVMPRSILPAMSMLAWRGRKQLPMVFDADGLPLDEKVDFAGESPSSLVHRIMRDVESEAVRKADVVLTRSARASGILQARAGAGTEAKKFRVVTNGRDGLVYHPGDETRRRAVRREFGVDDDAPLLVYAGSLGPQYCLDEMLIFFHAVRRHRPAARFLVLTGQRAYAESSMRQRDGLADGVLVASMTPGQVARVLPAGDLGVALRRVSFSMQAVAPVKLGEYLLCGMPVFATEGIGDTGCIGDDAGFLSPGTDATELEQAAGWFVHQVLPAREHFRRGARETGLRHFSLDASVDSYMDALRGVCRAAPG